MVIAQSISKKPPFAFLRDRFVRLYPSYFVANILTMFVVPPAGKVSPQEWLENIASLFWLQFPLGTSYLLGASWSLQFEISFYLAVAAVTFILISRMKAKQFFTLHAAAWLSLAACVPYFVSQTRLCASGCGLVSPLANVLSLGGYASYFVLGALLSRMTSASFRSSRKLLVVVSSCFVAVQVFFRLGGMHLKANAFLGVLVLGAAVVVIATSHLWVPSKSWKASESLRFLALTTYPIYLLHESTGLGLVSIMIRAGLGSSTAYLSTVLALVVASSLIVLKLDPWAAKQVKKFAV